MSPTSSRPKNSQRPIRCGRKWFLPPSAVIAAANAYFDAIETQGGNYKPAPFADDCNRFENGGQTTNVPGPNGRPPMGCAAQFDAKIFTWIPEVNDRRYPVVDPEHGVVLGIVMFAILLLLIEGIDRI